MLIHRAPCACEQPGFRANYIKKVGPTRLHLVPEGKHLDGTSAMPDVPNIIQCTSKAYATGGEHSAYYLNESRSQRQFAKDRNLVVVSLPSVKGSRQSITVQLPTAILRNLDAYCQYVSAVRAEDDPLNKLMETCWNGLRDRFVVAALRARSFVDVTFTTPMIFFTHSNLVERPMIRTIMDCAETYLRELGTEGYRLKGTGREARIDASCTLAADTLAKSILIKLPQLRAGYDPWWKSQRKTIEPAFATATKADYWADVSAHLRAASPFMIETHLRNLDKDCSEISELKYAPKTSDFVESGFAHVDLAMSTISGAGVESCLGVAHAAMLKAFETDGGKRAKARQVVLKKRKRELGGNGSLEEEIDEQVEAWDATSFFKLDRELRWTIIKDVRRRYKDLIVEAGRARQEAHDSARVKRLKEKSDRHVQKHLDRCTKYAEFDRIAPCTTLAGLDALATDDAKAYAEALRNQIRVRTHVYFVPRKELPNIGDGHSPGEVQRLVSGLRGLVEKPLKKKPAPPLPYPVRPAHPAPTAGAAALDIEHVDKISAAITKLMALTSEGVIRAPRASAPGRPRAAPPRAASSPPPPTRKRRAPAGPRAPRNATAAQASLVGESFEEEDIEWKVLMVGWCSEMEEIVVWYYDVEMAKDAELSDDDMEEARKAGELLAPVEVSRLSEVKRWISDSKRG